MCSLHIWRSLAMNLMPSQVFPISFIFFSLVRRHVILGRPLFRFPSGIQCIAVFAMEASWRVTWPIHLQRLLILSAGSNPPHHHVLLLLYRNLSFKMQDVWFGFMNMVHTGIWIIPASHTSQSMRHANMHVKNIFRCSTQSLLNTSPA